MINENEKEYFDPELVKALRKVFDQLLSRDSQRLKENESITEANVFQMAVKHNRDSLDAFIGACLLPGSKIENLDHWDAFYKGFKEGKSSLILAEHKSNLDVVIFYYLMKEINKVEEFDKIIFMAGRKLNEESVTVRLFAEMFNRIVVVPKSEIQEITDNQMEQIFKINYAAQLFLREHKQNNIFLIYPTGTRSRIWEPNSYEGITEIVNYIEKFDQIIFMSSDGNCMFPLPEHDMNSEPLIRNKIIIRFSTPLSVKDFLQEQKEKFHIEHPTGSRQELKSFITKTVTNSIYAQKEMPPYEEAWNDIVKKFLEKHKNTKDS